MVETTRSTDPHDYQHRPEPIGAMAKRFADGFVIPPHHHVRDQLLYATNGVMRVRTDDEAWIVPPNGAAYIRAGTRHAVSMHGNVDMRTLYIDPQGTRWNGPALRVVAVSGLLRELICALIEEPVSYGIGGRGSLIARLILEEITRAPALSLHIPLPRDSRLQRVCAELIADPSDRRTLDAWSDVAGASARTLARLFKRDLQMSFVQWRQRVRFQNALEDLSRGLPISKVADRHGYRSASAFSAAFAKATGRPPSKVAPDRVPS
ncbi:MAG: helix-turn-helix transcriptional regulator [Pseudomonadota bacterium]